MSRALAHRLRRLEERWALQMARRLEALRPWCSSLRTLIVSPRISPRLRTAWTSCSPS
jgi:hypothetical protein